MDCQFSVPVNLGNEEAPDWEFSEVSCQTEAGPAIFELIENQEYPREFYVQKTLSYGDAVIIWFLTLFAIAYVAKSIFNYFWQK